MGVDSSDYYSEELWKAPEAEMYTVQYRDGDRGQWQRTNHRGTIAEMKAVAQAMPDYRDNRVVKLSKYPPHPVQEIVLYLEKK